MNYNCSHHQPSTDVLACNRRPDNMVEVLDGWNMDYNNVPDNNMDTFTFNAALVNGRLQCRLTTIMKILL